MDIVKIVQTRGLEKVLLVIKLGNESLIEWVENELVGLAKADQWLGERGVIRTYSVIRQTTTNEYEIIS